MRGTSTRPGRIAGAALAISVTLALGCSEPHEFGEAGYLVTGTVRTDGQVRPGILVRAAEFLQCPEGDVDIGLALVVTGQDGRYHAQYRTPFGPGYVFCGEVRAYFEHGGEPDSITIRGFPIPVTGLDADFNPTDSAIIDIEIPPP